MPFIPSTRRARQARSVDAEHGADLAHRHLRSESLESFAALGEATRAAEILVDYFDLIGAPPELGSSLSEPELALGAGAMLRDLRRCRLPRVNECTPISMLRPDLIDARHRFLRRRGARAAPSRRATGRSLLAVLDPRSSTPRPRRARSSDRDRSLVVEGSVSGWRDSDPAIRSVNFSATSAATTSRPATSNKTG